MTNRAGTRFAQRLADYLADQLGLPVERRAQRGTKDAGDIAGIDGWVLEAKNERAISLGTTMNEAQREARNAGVTHYVAVFNRRAHQLDRSYAVLELRELARLLALDLRGGGGGRPAGGGGCPPVVPGSDDLDCPAGL